jgi:methylase of polypeptide subunit release factors
MLIEEKADQFNKFVVFSERLLNEMNAPLGPNSKILELGSGSGLLVEAIRSYGFDGYG